MKILDVHNEKFDDYDEIHIVDNDNNILKVYTRK